jgi:DNA polymerase-3 subunit gamma/tau
MSYQVLARKWRPQRFQDVIGQEHITRSLQNAIIRNELGHAYILTGTRGIGKTSVARLFAKAIRCESLTEDGNPCHECISCQDFDSGSSMNVIEIDGASNNSVDNVRDLVGNVQYTPTMGRYKVYIIDEVHMLSNQAFNALLKTLEEPPEHVIFIMATTEPHKLLGTVLSRCQRFDFRNASIVDLALHLNRIAEQEGIEFANERIVRQICREGKGSVRDTLSLLDQVLTYSDGKKIDEESLSLSLGLADTTAVRWIIESLFKGDAKELSQTVDRLMTQNVSVNKLAYAVLDQLYEIIRNVDAPEVLKAERLIDPVFLDDISSAELFWVYETLAKDFTWAIESLDPHRVFDICLQKVALRREFYSQEAPSTIKKKDDATLDEVRVTDSNNESEEIVPTPKPEAKSELEEEKQTQPQVKMEKTWEGFLHYMHGLSPASASNLEQGNLTQDITFDAKRVAVRLGFSEDQKVFYDYLSDIEVLKKLKTNLFDYFELNDEKGVDLQVELIGQQEKEEAGFMSLAELKNIDEEEALNKRKADFVSMPIIRQAEEIFKSKVDKIVFEKNRRP